MLGHRGLEFHDYVAILKRRLWLILLSGIVCLGLGLGLTYVLPPQYVSQTLVIVRQQRVPENYVKPVVTEDLNARLASMKEQILSRSRLEPVIERFNLFAGKAGAMDERVDLTRKAIQITPIIPSGANKTPGFFISFKAETARTAQQVCAEITSLFVSESLNAREQSAEGTTTFLSQQLADAKRALDEQDAKLAQFEQKYFGKLPDQEQSNLSALQALTSQLDAVTQSINRMHQEETFLEALLSDQPGGPRSGDSVAATSADDKMQERLRALIEQKKELDAIDTPDHPDVVALARQIEELRKGIAEAAAHPAERTVAKVPAFDSPQTLKNKAQLRVLKDSITAQREQQQKLEQEIRLCEGRIQSSPLVEQQYKQITRDHESALQFYNNLLSKMNESSMATNLERRQQGEQFQVLDAANLPDQPVFPNPIVFSVGGFLIGVLLGAAISAALEYRDTSIRSEKDVLAFTDLPTLAVISYIEELAQASRGRKSMKRLLRANRSNEIASS